MPDRVTYFEIPVSDVTKSKKFYTKVFGWKFTKVPMPGIEYWMIDTGSKEISGGLYKKMDPNQGPVNYASVKSIDATLKKLTRGGGRILSPKQEIQGVRWVAIGADPEGNQVGFYQDKPKRRTSLKSK